MSNCCVWDFRFSKAENSPLEINKVLEKIAKKWAYQLERGEESGYLHFQGRMSLKMKSRLKPLKEKFIKGAHLSITSNENKNNMFYVMKEETRIDGPWLDTDVQLYIPRQIREIESLFPWQEKVIEISKIWNKRTINVIVDTEGCKGKTTLMTYMSLFKLGRMIPCVNNYKDLMQMIMQMPTATTYLLDMPRAINKENLAQMYSALETIKGGYAWDIRYKFQEKYFDCPNIFVFTNVYPDTTQLSKDMWRFWEIKDKELHQMEIPIFGASLED